MVVYNIIFHFDLKNIIKVKDNGLPTEKVSTCLKNIEFEDTFSTKFYQYSFYYDVMPHDTLKDERLIWFCVLNFLV